MSDLDNCLVARFLGSQVLHPENESTNSCADWQQVWTVLTTPFESITDAHPDNCQRAHSP